VTLAVLVLALGMAVTAGAQEGSFLSEEEAPAAVFPGATHFERSTVDGTPQLRAAIVGRLRGVTPSLWEERYVISRAERNGTLLGHAILVEEIGKHRAITFVVGVRPDGRVEDVAVIAYREPYGGEIRDTRFLAQYRGKGMEDSLRAYTGIKNVAGATLSVEAASRAVRKAQAVAAVLELGGR
jgi:hypothetical protein